MSGSASRLFDVPGPRARRRITVLTALSIVGIAAAIAYAIYLFGAHGQLAPEKWVQFTEWPIIRYLLGAFGKTLLAAAGAAAIALPLGLALAVGRMSVTRWLRLPSVIVIEFFRAVPLLLIIYIFLIALPRYGINPELFWKLVIPIGLCSAATIAEVFRAGVLALPTGQREAGLSIGLTAGQVFRIIEFPQAVRMVIPSLVAQVVILLKDTTLGYVVSYGELQHSAKVLIEHSGNLIQTYLVVTLIYIVVNVVISQLAQRWQTRRSGVRSPVFGLGARSAQF